MLYVREKKFADLRKISVRKKSLGPQITNPQLTILQIKKDWVRKSQIRKVPHLLKIRKCDNFKVRKFADLRFAEFIADSLLTGVGRGRCVLG
jgi:hypothetical protein